jgi:hypothetical protein
MTISLMPIDRSEAMEVVCMIVILGMKRVRTE